MRTLPVLAALTTLTAATVLTTASLSPAISAGQQATTSVSPAAKAAAAKRVPTPFALASSGFGSRVLGGSLPSASDGTAYTVIGCTNLAGADRTNYENETDIPGLGTLEGVKTRVWTVKKGDTVSSYSSHSIAKLSLLDTPLGSLEIRGIESLSHAFNKSGRFGAESSGSVAKIVFAAPGGAPQTLDLPAPNRPLVIPGLAKIAVGQVDKNVNSDLAKISANVLDITVIPTKTRVQIAQTQARIGGGITRGVFRGFSAGINAKGLADNTRVGRTPLNIMPCQGTGGEQRVKDVARLNLADQVIARGVASGQTGTQTAARTFGTERAKVAHVELAGGQVEINGIVGQVNVSRTAGGVVADSKGTTVLEVIINGETYSFPKVGAIEIPGLIKLEDNVTTKIANGLQVVGVRATLLDGTGAVVDLGTARLQVRPSGVR